MSYNSETGIISAPVSIDDVKQALGESSNCLLYTSDAADD